MVVVTFIDLFTERTPCDDPLNLPQSHPTKKWASRLDSTVTKPHQVTRLKPTAVVLGASNAEVGLNPRHPGWATDNAFNFALPAANSYAVMLAFLHAQKAGGPLKKAVVNLDFFSYNINFPVSPNFIDRRFDPEACAGFAKYLDDTLQAHSAVPALAASEHPNWDETLYLAVNPDIAAAIARGEFKSGKEHWELTGRIEHRRGSVTPDGWDEAGYLFVHPDVANEISRGTFVSGYHHYLAAGLAERRIGGFQPKEWDEAQYFAVNPDARIRVALGHYRNGYLHYAAVGRHLGLLGGLPPAGLIERLRRRTPRIDRVRFNLGERLALALNDAEAVIFRTSEPSDFNDRGLRDWDGRRDAFIRHKGGAGTEFRGTSTFAENFGGRPWFVPPHFQFCFTNVKTGMTTFDPYRFMLRRAYAEGTEMHLFTSPSHAATYQLFHAVDLYERYEFWLKELVRINEAEAARADTLPFPIWDFGYANSITVEPIPAIDDLRPMRWYWESQHYRKALGDIVLDRIFDHADPARTLPSDFGVRLTSENIGAHLIRTRAALADWAAANAEIVDLSKHSKAQTRQDEVSCW